MNRRQPTWRGCASRAGAAVAGTGAGAPQPPRESPAAARRVRPTPGTDLRLFLCGDVMLARGIDQILPQAVDPMLHEQYVRDARTYVRLAEQAHGPIPGQVAFDYVWGDALAELERVAPHARVINLENAVTTCDDHDAAKGIHYRMHPGNVPVLTAAGIDACALANNHVLDWGTAGLRETLHTVRDAGLPTAGAGRNAAAAAAPASLDTAAGRLLVFAYGTPGSGVPLHWQATTDHPGVNVLPSPIAEQAETVIDTVASQRREGDRVIVSIHQGGNWGHVIADEQRAFAHALLDSGQVDLVHGHSSHHPQGIEIHRGRLILHGCGDFLNDYEGIGGHAAYRPDLTLMYFPVLEPSGALRRLEMTPLRIRRFRLERADDEDAAWLCERMDRECGRLGVGVEMADSGRLRLRWRD